MPQHAIASLLAGRLRESRRTARAWRRVRCLAADGRGSAAVEFALVAMPFLALVGAIIQVAFQIWAAQNFDRAVQNGVRTVLTGQFQLANAGKTDAPTLLANLRATMCGSASANIVTVFDCSKVRIEVATAGTFAGAAPVQPIDTSTGSWSTSFGTNYACAKPGTIVVVTAAVPFPAFFNLLGLVTRQFTSGADNGSGLLTATAVLRTEPYQVTGAGAC
ncbi:TadE/TadG family type IV pilus assembly protein [Methylobacterium currus]|uniref:TadE/TadG family type IV pilus assembly protein n=1 Tax=Methylobacterium currus TaxID=2051553 RepID=UPI0022AB4558|nr:TadE/TadG family type IV pilus assembly protein [Methylobacterium currus]